MLIRCPDCNEECETEAELAPGQHVICPFCETRFSYAPQESTVENVAKGKEGQNETVRATIKIACPYCGAGYEVDAGYEGEIATCGTCDKKFVMQVVKKEEPFLPSQLQNSSFAEEPKVVPKRDSKPVLKPVAKPVLKPVVKLGLSANPPQEKAGKAVGGRFFIKKKKRFCRECGSELNPAKPRCPKCGAMSIAESSSARISRVAGDVSNHVGMAIVAIVLFLPLGVIALVFALQAQSRQAFGDDYGAEDAARTAHACAKIGIILGLIGFTGWFSWWLYVSYQADKAYQNMIREQRELERTIQNINYYY